MSPLSPTPSAPSATTPTDTELARLLRVPGDHDHKYTRGVLGVWAGSQTYPGAAVLVCAAAVRAGAGMVRLQAPQRVADLVLSHRPEVVPAPGRCQALVIGPGTEPDDVPRAAELGAALDLALGAAGDGSAPLPAVVDAGALPLLASRLRAGARCRAAHVLTPHAGEAAALLGALGQPRARSQVEQAPAQAARQLASLTGATVVLKATPTLVATPPRGDQDGPLLALDPGPGWLATAGSGDVLAGLLGALLASAQAALELRPATAETAANGACRAPGAAPGADLGPQAARLAALAVRAHALAGQRAAGALVGGPGHPIAAGDLVGALPQVLGELLKAVGESRP